MNVRQSIEKGLEPILREAMAAAKLLGLPVRDRRQARKAALAEESFLSKESGEVVDPLDTYRGTDKNFQRRRALYALTYLLNPFYEGYGDTFHPLVWMKELQVMLDLLRTALPRARREPSDRAALARHEKLERTREAIDKLQRELKEIEASPARKAA